MVVKIIIQLTFLYLFIGTSNTHVLGAFDELGEQVGVPLAVHETGEAGYAEIPMNIFYPFGTY